MRKKLEESMLKIALLSVSLLVASAPAINANIPAMAKAFPNVPLSTVELLTTISSMFLMICCHFCNFTCFYAFFLVDYDF